MDRRISLVTVVLAMLVSACSGRGVASRSPESEGSSSTTSAATASESQLPPHVLSETMVGDGPSDVTAAFGSIWVSNHHDDNVTRVDPTTEAIIATIPVGGQPELMAVGMGSVWETNYDGTIGRVDPSANSATSIGHFGHLCGGPTLTPGAVWVYRCDEPRTYVARVDVRTGKTTARIPAGQVESSLLFADGFLWMTTSSPGKILQLDPNTGKVLRSFPASGCPLLTQTGFGFGSMWVGQSQDCGSPTMEILRMDPRTGRIVATVSTPSSLAPSVADGSLWLEDIYGALSRMDPATLKTTPWTDFGYTMSSPHAGFGSLWVVSFDLGELFRVDSR